jgi:hypothetical protein
MKYGFILEKKNKFIEFYKLFFIFLKVFFQRRKKKLYKNKESLN